VALKDVKNPVAQVRLIIALRLNPKPSPKDLPKAADK
jgi:hypothetical protein